MTNAGFVESGVHGITKIWFCYLC